MQHKGKITISRLTSNQLVNPDWCPIRIEVIDESSHTEFLEIGLTLEQLAEALTGYGRVDCTFDLRAQHVGKIRENKTEIVRRLAGYIEPSNRRRVAAKLLKPYKVDGWNTNDDDALFNSNRLQRDASGTETLAYMVHFFRYVDPT